MPVKHKKQAIKWLGTIQDMGKKILGKKSARALGSGVSAAINRGVSSIAPVPAFKKGGRVKRTGLAKVHAGEIVLSAPKVRMLKKLLK